MNTFLHKTLSAFGAVFLILAAGGCARTEFLQQPKTPETSAVSIPKQTPQELYLQAVAALDSDIQYTVTQNTEILTAENKFQEVSQQTVTHLGYGTPDQQTQLQQTLDISGYQIIGSAYYQGGVGIYQVGDARFQQARTAEEFCKMLTPAVLIDHSIYRSITSETNVNGTAIAFAGATKTECWSRFAEGQLLEGSGKVQIDADGNLQMCTYTLSCLYGPMLIRQKTTVRISEATAIIGQQGSMEACIAADPEAAWMLERASGYLLSTNSLSSQAEQRITCEAYGDVRTQKLTLNLSDGAFGLIGQLTISVDLQNPSTPKETSEARYQVHYQNGIWRAEDIGAGSIQEYPVVSQDANTALRQMLLETLILPEDILALDVAYPEDRIVYAFSLRDERAKTICWTAHETLYPNAQLSQPAEQLYDTKACTAYLEIEPYTGLPVASGIHYTGEMELDGHVYALTFSDDQQYSFSPAQ